MIGPPDTIYALSSGAPPAAIALVRVSGPAAFAAGTALAGSLPAPRRAGVRRLRDRDGVALDDALVLAFPGPGSATGEDLLELHLHGGRAVVRAVVDALAIAPGLRPADPGEFTRRALGNGRIDLAEAEGLADLLAAESETARRAAFAAAEGGVSRAVREWSARLLALAARLEAQIDFAEEDDLPAEADELAGIQDAMTLLTAEWEDALAAPPIERLRDGFRIVLAGPPNSGKSSLINVLAGREVAIATAVPGTTRDRIEAPVSRDGIGYILTDTAGLRDATDDPIEAIGMARTREAVAAADLVLWLGDPPEPEAKMLSIHARADLPGRGVVPAGRLAVSAQTGAGVAKLWTAIASRCADLLPRSDLLLFNERQRAGLAVARNALELPSADSVILSEQVRAARSALDAITGVAATEQLLNELFGRFCLGK